MALVSMFVGPSVVHVAPSSFAPSLANLRTPRSFSFAQSSFVAAAAHHSQAHTSSSGRFLLGNVSTSTVQITHGRRFRSAFLRAPAVRASADDDIVTLAPTADDSCRMLRIMFALSLVLRAVGPLALLMTALTRVAPLPCWRWLRVWFAAEALFYVASCALARRLCVHTPPPPLGRARRRELWRRILADPGSGGSVASFASAWFQRPVWAPPVALAPWLLPSVLRHSMSRLPTAEEVTYDELHLCDVEAWLAWGLMGKRRRDLDADEMGELRDLVGDLEAAAGSGRRLKPRRPPGSPRAPFTPMRPQVDPVRWTARPLLYYAISHLVGRAWYTPRTMRAARFGPRTTLACAAATPRQARLSYFYRPGGACGGAAADGGGTAQPPPQQQTTPFVFIHGIGVGPAPYSSYLDGLAEASGAPVIAMELAGFAQRLSVRRVVSEPAAPLVDPPAPADFAAAVGEVLARHGHTSAHVIGHSLGAAYASYVATHAPTAVASMSFIDPINLGMHDARVTRAFMYTPADSLQHETDNYFFKSELFTSHVIARGLWWYEAAQWPQEARADTPTLVALSMDDEIVPTASVRDSWGAEGMRERGVRVHEMGGIGHGGWLADEAAQRGLVRATLEMARLAPVPPVVGMGTRQAEAKQKKELEAREVDAMAREEQEAVAGAPTMRMPE